VQQIVTTNKIRAVFYFMKLIAVLGNQFQISRHCISFREEDPPDLFGVIIAVILDDVDPQWRSFNHGRIMNAQIRANPNMIRTAPPMTTPSKSSPVLGRGPAT
jgi:hypothetical protein